MKHILSTIIISSLIAVTASSCTGKFEEINSNPYQPGDLSEDDYALGSAMNNLAGCVVSPDVNTAQFTDCLLGGPLGGYFADSQSTWKATISNYNPTDDWTRVFLKSDRVLPVLFSNLNVVEIVSQNTNNPLPLAIAQVIKVAAMHRVTDAYGPIPYSQIGVDGSIKSPYDSEQQVYAKFFEELNASIKIMNEQSNDRLTASADYIYSGDVKKWIRFANSLKLRLAMRIVNADPTTARKMVEEALDPQYGGVIEQNADNAAWRYFAGSVTNPIYTATQYNHVLSHNDSKNSISYTDPNKGLNSYADELTKLTVKWNENATPEEKQERIIIQKWIANWQLGNEAWADYRRTGYPNLLPATDDGNKSGGVVDSERGARRIPYPASEYNDNIENIQFAVNTYLGGQDNMAKDLWWAKNN